MPTFFFIARPVRLAYQLPATILFSQNKLATNNPPPVPFLSDQISTCHQPPAKRTG
jgi:hypothetical protein